MIRKFRKKPIIIEAVQLTEGTLLAVGDFIGEHKNYPECKIAGINPATGKYTIKTLEGDMVAEVGDWIIKGIKGEFYPCKPDIFQQTYDEVDKNE